MRKKTIALDFDGVLHGYSKKWHDGTIYDPPMDGAVEAIQELAKRFNLIIFTCREPTYDVVRWMRDKFDLDVPVTGEKPHADMYIDDRGWHHTDWESTLAEIDHRERYNFGSGDEMFVPSAPHIRTETISAEVIK